MPVARAVEEVEEVVLSYVRRGETHGDIFANLNRQLIYNRGLALVARIFGHPHKGVNTEGHGEEISLVYQDKNGVHSMNVDGQWYKWDETRQKWIKQKA